MLELGKTRREKRRVIAGLVLAHLLSLTVFVGLFAWNPQLPPQLAAIAIVSVTLWLLTFVLLCVNVAYYLMKRS